MMVVGIDDRSSILQKHDSNVLLNTEAAAAKPVATAVLMIVVSVFDDVFVATAGIAVLFPDAETSAVVVDALLAP